MIQIGENSPLSISKEAQIQLEALRAEQHHPKNAFLRVKAHVPVMGDSISFNMFFDDAIDKNDMIYQEGTTGVVLDSKTALHLVGSELVMMPTGELIFTHMPTHFNFGAGEEPIYN